MLFWQWHCDPVPIIVFETYQCPFYLTLQPEVSEGKKIVHDTHIQKRKFKIMFT